MKNTLPLIFALLLFQTQAQYIYPDQEVAALVNSKDLVVQLLPESSGVEKALNNVLKETFQEYWPNKNVKYMFPKGVKALLKSKTQDYAFLTQTESLGKEIKSLPAYANGRMEEWILGASKEATTEQKNALSNFSYDKVQLEYHEHKLSVFDGKREKIATIITFVNGNLGKHDYVFLSQQLRHLLKSAAAGVTRDEFWNVEENIKALRNTKYSLLEDYFKKENVYQIDKTLVNLYTMIPFKTYQKIIVEKTLGRSYPKIIFSYLHGKFMWIMIRSSDGRILSINSCNNYKFTGSYPANEMIRSGDVYKSMDDSIQILFNKYR
tara:strand:+ start:1756 stop:2721 length:966 start_codon:yes stop_codon:yes gene_type:complete